MSKKVELHKKYVKLIQSGKKDEAQDVLKEIWSLKKGYKLLEVKKPVKETPVKKIKKPAKERALDSLVKVRGIGKKTVDDIKKIYTSLADLKKALRSNKVPLRDDICNKLKKELI